MQDFACIAAELIAWCPREGMDVEIVPLEERGIAHGGHSEGRSGQTVSLAELDVIYHGVERLPRRSSRAACRDSDELLTFLRFPKALWKTFRTTKT